MILKMTESEALKQYPNAYRIVKVFFESVKVFFSQKEYEDWCSY